MSSTPICRCRVLYMGSAVPHITKDGLHGIQEPLRSLYPEEGVQGARGIDSWLSVWSNGLLLENVDEKQKRVTRFFPIEALHYCAAVRHVTIPGADGERVARFLPLDSPFARIPTANNPPLFACILRRTAGIKVLECHAFVAKKEMAANALVRCCFHAYADNMYAKRLENGGDAAGSVYGGSGIMAQTGAMINGAGGGDRAVIQLLNGRTTPNGAPAGNASTNGINPIQKVEQWRAYVHHTKGSGGGHEDGDSDDGDAILDNGEIVSIYDGDENHKVWAGSHPAPAPVATTDDQQSIYADFSSSTIRSVKSVNGNGNSSTLRTSRPRQIAAPASPPPPPPPPAPATNGKSGTLLTSNGNTNKTRPRKMVTNGTGPHHYPGHPPNLPPPPPNQNGYHHPAQLQRRPPPPGVEFQPMWAPPPGRKMRPGGPALNGHPQQQPQIVPYGFPPPPPNMMAPLPPPPHLMGAFRPYPPMMQHPPPGSSGKSKKGGVSAEEPVYLPSARPMSPVASYQPGAFPYEQYYLNQSGHSHQGPPPPPGSHYAHPGQHRPSSNNGSSPSTPQPPPTSTLASSGKTNTKYKKKKSDKPGSSGESAGGGGGSKFNTGIYRKKGHLNERAFSYSIRQEHRSRSHSSLATLNFNGPSNGIEVIGNGIEDTDVPPMINGGHHHSHHYGGATNGGHDNHNKNAKNVTTTTALVNTPPHSNGQQQHNGHQNGGSKMSSKSPQNGSASAVNGKNAPQQRGAPQAAMGKSVNGSKPGQNVANGKRNGNGSTPTNGGVHRMMNDLSLSDGEFEEQPVRVEQRMPSMSRRKILAANNR